VQYNFFPPAKGYAERQRRRQQREKDVICIFNKRNQWFLHALHVHFTSSAYIQNITFTFIIHVIDQSRMVEKCHQNKKHTWEACKACSRNSCFFSLNLQISGVLVTANIKDLIGWMRKNNRAARAACFLAQFLVVVCLEIFKFEVRTTTRSTKKIYHSLPLCENRSFQSSERTLPLFPSKWPTWNNHETRNLLWSTI